MIAKYAPNVLAVIVSYNDFNGLSRNVSALLGQVERILIVDNGSDAETLVAISGLQRGLAIDVVLQGFNSGIGCALNAGLRFATDKNYRWMLTMDQDSIASENMVLELLESAFRYPDAGIICASTSDVASHDKDRIVTYSITSGNLVDVHKLKNLIGYNEQLFIDGVDFEICLRMRNYGYSIINCSNARFEHKLGKKIVFKILGIECSYILHTPVRRYYIFRNNLYLTSKYIFSQPKFIIKKNLFIMIYFFDIMIFDDKRIENLRMIFYGVRDFFFGRSGPY